MDILAESPDRFLLLPVRDERAWAFYQEAVACFWTAQELDLTHDRYSELQDSDGRQRLPFATLLAGILLEPRQDSGEHIDGRGARRRFVGLDRVVSI